ncbi:MULTISPECIES: tyrosine--tRNA ligase [unclassified Halomonas]|uniref:tyrosine--tRNA ligase n=1 Tax=unclassified Halomonas TaxID=2609666 RepID=UPI00099093D9|nr:MULTISPECIES: tyrosine--tRNA ligase [unclassified Halomonas]AQU82860.1 tyrosine--tRNA ligase [Halomonas sp. 'Soap Lake \
MSTSLLLSDLHRRGLIAQTTHEQALSELLSSPQTVYCGFDPTAGSLHIGHLVPLLMLKRFQDAGHHGVALVGGATGMIGDPSFKATERSLNSPETVKGWVKALNEQIYWLMAPHLEAPFKVVDNAQWIGEINVIDFFRDVGKHFSMNAMINRESVRQRLERPDQGMSFTEFSYALLQSYDFAHLNRTLGCRLQIGGNDQWGNIVSGVDLTRRLNSEQVMGMTLPLITKADGTKFGKTESGTVWLDPKQTSPYHFYQFWLGTDDRDVYRFLRYYTFLSCDAIDEIEANDRLAAGKPQAQRILAETVTRFVHGEEGLETARRISQALFSGDVATLALHELEQLALDGLPCFQVSPEEPLEGALVKGGLASSKRQARELIEQGAVRINGERAGKACLGENFALFDTYWVVQKGKKHFCLLTRATQ